MRGCVRDFRTEEWIWVGVIAVAVLIMIGVTVAPLLA